MSLNGSDHTKAQFPIRSSSEKLNVEGRRGSSFSIDSQAEANEGLDFDLKVEPKRLAFNEPEPLRQAPVQMASSMYEEFESDEASVDEFDFEDRRQALKVLCENHDFVIALEVAKSLSQHPSLDLSSLELVLEVFKQNSFHAGEEAILLRLQDFYRDQPDQLFCVYKALGNARLKMQDFEGSEESYFKAFRIDPNSATLLVNIGTLEFRKTQYTVARERFVQALEIDAENDKAWVGLGLVHSEFGDFDLSLANLERALQINPGNRTAIQLYVEIGFKHGHLQKVLQKVEDFLLQEPSDIELLMSSAKMNFVLAKHGKVQEICRKVLQLDPSHGEAKSLSRSSEDQGRDNSPNA